MTAWAFNHSYRGGRVIPCWYGCLRQLFEELQAWVWGYHSLMNFGIIIMTMGLDIIYSTARDPWIKGCKAYLYLF